MNSEHHCDYPTPALRCSWGTVRTVFANEGIQRMETLAESAARPSIRWRRKRDSNPRYPSGYNGFNDRRLKPLGHSSKSRLTESGPGMPWANLHSAVLEPPPHGARDGHRAGVVAVNAEGLGRDTDDGPVPRDGLALERNPQRLRRCRGGILQQRTRS